MRNLRSLYDVGPVPVQRRLTVLTGQNDGGKTATLVALALLLRGDQLQPEDLSKGAPEGEGVEVEGVFYALDDSKEERPRLKRARWQPGTATVRETTDRVHKGFGAAPADLALSDLKARMQALGIPSPGGSAKQPYVDAAQGWLAGRPGEEFEERWGPLSPSERDRLPALTRFSSVEVPDPASALQSVITREARRLLKLDKYSDRLASVGKDLDAEVASAIADVRNKVAQYCPDIEEIQVSAAFDFSTPAAKVDIRLRRQGRDLDFSKGGEGRRRRVALAIHEAGLRSLSATPAVSTEVIAYDEPDTHLDYRSQRELFGILERQAALPHVQVVVVTHSLNFIDRVPLQVIAHFRLNTQLQTEVEVLSSTGYADELTFLGSIGVGLGLRNSVLLDERCFLVVEGETEETALPSLFQLVAGRSMAVSGVALFNTRGSGALRRIVEVMVIEWKRAVVVLSDNDQRGDVLSWCARLGLTEGAGLYFIGSKEFEDAFSDEVWLRVLKSHFPPQDAGAPWSLEELSELRSAADRYGDALRNLVSKRCRNHRIGKPDLGAALGREVRDQSDLPATLQTCLGSLATATLG